MSTKVINNNMIKDEDITKLIFNVDTTDGSTLSTIVSDSEYYLTISCEDFSGFIDKHSIDNLILALQEAKRLWGDE